MVRYGSTILGGLLLLAGCGETHREDAGARPAGAVAISPVQTGGDSTVTVFDLSPEALNLPERHYLVLRQRLPLSEMNGFMAMEGKALVEAAQRKNITPTGPISTLFYDWNTAVGMGDAAVALPVAPGTSLPPYVMITLPAGRALRADLKGSYEKLSAAHFGLESELSRLGLRAGLPTVEVYHTGPLDTSDETAFYTEILYPIETPTE